MYRHVLPVQGCHHTNGVLRQSPDFYCYSGEDQYLVSAQHKGKNTGSMGGTGSLQVEELQLNDFRSSASQF